MQEVTIPIAERAKQLRGYAVLAILALLVITFFIISMNIGYIHLNFREMLEILLGFGTAKQNLVLLDLRLPRIVIAVFVGAALSLSGCILQGVSRNPLADPGILGINAGAGMAVVLFISFYPIQAGISVFLLPFIAFIGASLAAGMIYILAYQRNQGLSGVSLVLVGIAVAAGLSAAMIIFTIRMNPNDYHFISVWLAGSIWGSNWSFILALMPWLLVLIPFVFYKARVLNILGLGDQIAVGVGLDLEKERFALLAAAVGLASACSAVSGAIGFVGLIGPHLARQLVGNQHQLLIPAAALVGSLLFIIADIVARVLFQPAEIPTGIVIAVIGTPYFLYLLARSKHS
ncbi:FecCD family ABC transporter permease [Anaerosinus massiliensis]|uniref:FecCD family ABC transporter permease n=1 Tax=Massilibacillus massiliensis TaxID=1806837 RepID=UPI000AA276F4|nr:iron ABC transporter permease [Massilibacillus massiliensis]